jgi:hypothetical protein
MEQEKGEMEAVFTYKRSAVEKALLEYHTKKISFSDKNYDVQVLLPDNIQKDYTIVVTERPKISKPTIKDFIKTILNQIRKGKVCVSSVNS